MSQSRIRSAAAPPRSRDATVRGASRVLAREPNASLGDVAAALGIGRTTLHRMFPTRRDLLVAIAHDAIDNLATVYADAGLGRDLADGAAVREVLDRVVEELIPLGAGLLFLLRATELDEDTAIAKRAAEVDRPLRDAIALAQQYGSIAADLPVWWVTEMLLADIYVAWEQIELGRLAPLDAAALVMRTWTRGVHAEPPR